MNLIHSFREVNENISSSFFINQEPSQKNRWRPYIAIINGEDFLFANYAHMNEVFKGIGISFPKRKYLEKRLKISNQATYNRDKIYLWENWDKTKWDGENSIAFKVYNKEVYEIWFQEKETINNRRSYE